MFHHERRPYYALLYDFELYSELIYFDILIYFDNIDSDRNFSYMSRTHNEYDWIYLSFLVMNYKLNVILSYDYHTTSVENELTLISI